MANRSAGMTVIAILALVQSIAGVLRALHLFDLGSDLLGQGLLILPMIGLVAFARGAVVAAIALLYVIFAFGEFTGRGWAWPLGLVVTVVNLLLVLSVVIQGEFLARALLWAIIPVIIVYHLFSPTGQQALKSEQ